MRSRIAPRVGVGVRAFAGNQILHRPCHLGRTFPVVAPLVRSVGLGQAGLRAWIPSSSERASAWTGSHRAPGSGASSARSRQPEHPRSGQGDRFEEVTGQERLCLGAQEVDPGRGRAVGRGVDPGLLQDPPYGGGCDLHPSTSSSSCSRRYPQRDSLWPGAGPRPGPNARCGPARACGLGPGVPARDQVAVPAQHRVGAYEQAQSLQRLPGQAVQQRSSNAQSAAVKCTRRPPS